MNNRYPAIHSNAQKILLHRYTHIHCHCYWYIWVPSYLSFACSSLICGGPVSFNCGRLPTKIGLSVSKPSFMKITTVCWYVTLVDSYGCDDKYISVYVFSTSFSLHDLWPCYILTEYHDPTSLFLDSTKLNIAIVKFWIAICVTRVVS